MLTSLRPVGATKHLAFRLLSVALVLCVLSGAAIAQPAGGGKRIALVVGNSAYQAIPRLANPTNDARLIGDTLKALGFTLVGGRAQLDLDKGKFEAVLADFGRQIRGADVALFFYAGHGIQLTGVNWLVPISARPQTEGDVPVQMVDANTVLRYMDSAGAKLNIVVLDACRNNPFAADVAPGRTGGLSEPQPQGSSGRVASLKGIRSTGGGLGRMQAPAGTLIAYATQPGNVALDGNAGNSPFSSALADTIKRPGLDIFRVFNEVGLRVSRATSGSQQPWVSMSPIEGDYFFGGPSSTQQPATASVATAPAGTEIPTSAYCQRTEITGATRPGGAESTMVMINDGGGCGTSLFADRQRTEPLYRMIVATAPRNGTVYAVTKNRFLYQPFPGFYGDDRFSINGEPGPYRVVVKVVVRQTPP
jgi:uncharacterized caspase-like protein